MMSSIAFASFGSGLLSRNHFAQGKGRTTTGDSYTAFLKDNDQDGEGQRDGHPVSRNPRLREV